MSGKKGRSGRKSLLDEVLMHKTVDLAWRTIYNALVSDKIPDDIKREIALDIVKKSCPITVQSQYAPESTKIIVIRADQSAEVSIIKTEKDDRRENQTQALPGRISL